MHAQTTRASPQSSSQPFSPQDLISNSLYYLQYSSLVVSVENLVFDIFFIFITCLLIFHGCYKEKFCFGYSWEFASPCSITPQRSPITNKYLRSEFPQFNSLLPFDFVSEFFSNSRTRSSWHRTFLDSEEILLLFQVFGRVFLNWIGSKKFILTCHQKTNHLSAFKRRAKFSTW